MTDIAVRPVRVGVALFGVSIVVAAASRLLKQVRPRKRRFRCIALDLDGTTLNSQHEISHRTKLVLQRLQSNGVKICICTGRSVVSVMPILKTLAITSDIPIVVYNGSSSFVVSTEMEVTRRLFSTPHPPEDSLELINFAQRLGLVTQYYMEHSGDVFAVPFLDEHHELLDAYARLTGRRQVLGADYAEAMAQSRAAKVLLLSKDADAVIAAAKEEFPEGKYNIIRGSPEPFFVEFLPANVSKGSGLQNLCQAMGIPIEEVVAFGDGDNDAEFLEYAGLGVAMKNAKTAAKAKADIILELTNDEEGVAFALEELDREGCFVYGDEDYY